MSGQLKKQIGRQLFSLDPVKLKGKAKEEAPYMEDKLVIDDFNSGSEDDFDVICNMVSLISREYDCVIKVSKPVDYEEEETTRPKHVCYFVMNNGCIKEQNVFLERPNEGMENHLKPLL